MHKTETLIVLGVGVLIGNYMTYRYMAKRYNELARKHNRLIEFDHIKQRVFKEIMPQLPDDYTLTEQTMIDIHSANMFIDNDM